MSGVPHRTAAGAALVPDAQGLLLIPALYSCVQSGELGAQREEALRLLFAEELDREPLPDLILLDWNLPKISGNQVLVRPHRRRRLASASSSPAASKPA